MNERQMPADVPYIVYEGTLARAERTIKRLTIGIIFIVVMLFVTNLAWLYVWNQYDTASYVQDGEGLNNICTGNQGDVAYGAEIKTADKKEP